MSEDGADNGSKNIGTKLNKDVLAPKSVEIIPAIKIPEIPLIHDGTHFMSPDDVKKYHEMFRKGEHKNAVIFLREKWNNAVDREFIQKFSCVHWVAGMEELTEFLSTQNSSQEISTQGYEEPSFDCGWLRAKLGLLVKGRVNLAGNADLQTNQWFGITRSTDQEVAGKRFTEYADRLIVNKETSITPYEFVLGDWQVVGIVSEPDNQNLNEVREVAKSHELPIFDFQKQEI